MVSDVIGRKKVIYFGLGLFIVGSLCAGLTNDIELLSPIIGYSKATHAANLTTAFGRITDKTFNEDDGYMS